jgi:hypothetical protein
VNPKLERDAPNDELQFQVAPAASEAGCMPERKAEEPLLVEVRKSGASFCLADYEPGTYPDLEQRLTWWVRNASDRPTIEVVTRVPQTRAAPSDLLDAFYEARNAVITSVRSSRGRGRPPRNAYLAAEVAYLWDLERKPLVEREGQVSAVSSAFAYLRPGERPLCQEVDRTMRRWLREGRETLAEIGAFPWSVCDRGLPPRRWWAEPRFDQALREWADGRRTDGAAFEVE